MSGPRHDHVGHLMVAANNMADSGDLSTEEQELANEIRDKVQELSRMIERGEGWLLQRGY